MAENMLVRIKPYNPKKGHLRRVHIEQEFGMRFKADGGWYEVPAAVARKLRKTLQNDNDPESAEVFDVVTKAQAQEIRQFEELKIEKMRATPDAPTKLTVRRPVGQRAPNDQEDEEMELAEETRTPAPRPRRVETKADRAVVSTFKSQAQARAPEAEEEEDSEDGAPPYGTDTSDPFDDDLSDVAAAEEPPTVKFDDSPAPAPARSGRGGNRRNSAAGKR